MSYKNKHAYTDVDDYLLEYEAQSADYAEGPSRLERCSRCVLIFISINFILALLVFLVLFVALPVSFMCSVGVQQFVLFPTYASTENEFANFRKYGLDGARNFYVDVQSNEAIITLGVWHVLPLRLLYTAVEDENYNYVEALRRSSTPVLLYFHDSDANRAKDVNKYRVLRRFFHVIAFDYRGYGDSADGNLDEDSLVEDCVELYKWLERKTEAPVYMWGHSLGASLAVSAVSRLHREKLKPKGLFLEAPYTSLNEAVYSLPVFKIFTWMPWLEATVLNPLEENGFHFRTKDDILTVDCPIMIIHAKDDAVISYELGKKLAQIANGTRDEENVTFHLFPGEFGFGHYNLHEALQLPDFIRKHIETCEDY